ncbi:MAG TPA: hypothetical protein VFS30_00550 [Dehalococcoidia bacterium]|nr:hypothetical protein [Dehalococcoidia bacterium]
MPTLPRANKVSPTDNKFVPATHTPEHQRGAADPHAPYRNLGSLASDPTYTPADGTWWVWYNTTSGALKAKLGDGTVHTLAPAADPVTMVPSGSYSVTTSVATITGMTFTATGAGYHLINAAITVGTPGATSAFQLYCYVNGVQSGNFARGETTDGDDIFIGGSWAPELAVGDVVTIRISRAAGSNGTIGTDRSQATAWLVGVSGEGGGGAASDHGALTGLDDNDHGAIYYTETEVDGLITTHAADDDAHHAVFTTTEHAAVGDGSPHHAAATASGAHSVSGQDVQAVAASETLAAHVELATDAEVLTGTDTARAVTPAGLKASHTDQADPHTGYVLESLFDAKGDIIAASADNTPAKLTVGTNGQRVKAASGETAGLVWADEDYPITVTFLGAGDVGAREVLPDGLTARYEVRTPGEIEVCTMLADQSGSVVVDIWKDTYGNYPPTVADTIVASAPPTITTAVKSQDSTLTGWTTTLAEGDVLYFVVDGAATSTTELTLTLKVRKS